MLERRCRAVVLRGLRAKLRKQKGDQQLDDRRKPPVEDRSSGEDALETIEDEAVEATPDGMPRLNTDEL